MPGAFDNLIPQRRGVIAPADPFKPRQEERSDAADRRAEEANRRAAEAEARAEAAERRAAEKDAQVAATLAARGGVESTGDERTAAFLATRLAGGIKMLSGMQGANTAPSLVEGTVGNTKMGNYAVSEQRQRVRDAQLDMLDAALTLGTGAAYNKEQLESYRQSYFPQPGDEPGTVADKQARLKILLEGSRLKAGAAAGQIDEALTNSGLFSSSQTPQGPAPSSEFFPNGPAGGMAVTVTGDVEPSAATPRSPTPTPSDPFQDSYLSQGLSGINEGLANTLGAPVDLATAAINLVPAGINAVANTNIGHIEDPFMGGQWWRSHLTDAGSILPQSNDPSRQFVRRVGESVGGAALPVAGTASTLGRAGAGLLSAAGGGAGAATAQQAWPDNPWAEMGGEIAGSVASGAGILGLANRSARNAAEAAVPTVPDLKNQASNLYSQAESRGVVGGPNVTANMAGRIEDIARRAEVVDSGLYPHANEAMRVAGRYSGQNINPTQIQVVREGLADAVQATEGRQRKIARDMLKAFDEETIPLAPELAEARWTASKYLQAGEVQKAIDLAGVRAPQFSQSGMSNALKTQFRGLERGQINGDTTFNPAVSEAISKVVYGTPSTKAAEWLGRFAPRSTSGLVLSGAPGAALMAGGDPVTGALLSGGVGGAGMIGRVVADKAVERNASIAELLARNGGALEPVNIVDDDMMRQIAGILSAEVAPYSAER